jgi:ribosomal protein S27AE
LSYMDEICGVIWRGEGLSPLCEQPRGHAGDHRHGLFRWSNEDMSRPPSYRCPRCGMVSFNPNDLQHRYCGFCHKFEDEP